MRLLNFFLPILLVGLGPMGEMIQTRRRANGENRLPPPKRASKSIS